MRAYKIAIIGLGPKGLYTLERLLAHLQSSDIDGKLEIHLFEKSGNFGSGEVYDPSQPNYLTMNYPNRNINVWPDESPLCPIDSPLSFSQWLAKKENIHADFKNDFAPRALVGRYLTDCFDVLNTVAASFCKIVKHHALVLDIDKKEKLHTLRFSNSGMSSDRHLDVNIVIITTGHCSWKGNLKNPNNENLNVTVNNMHIPFVYPVTKKLASVMPGATVAIKGMGLTFIDAVLALTEGRGGSFEKNERGALFYIPSEMEPQKIVAFSRSGLPMVPRSAQEGNYYEAMYFTSKAIEDLTTAREKPSFIEHILPLYKLETKYRYYKVLFEHYNLTLYADKNDGLERQIAIFHDSYPDEPRFEFANLFKPRNFANPSVTLDSLAYLRYLVAQAELGSQQSAFMAASMTWGKLGTLFGRIYNFGGMTPDSHWLFDQKYRSKLNRISYGPPLENMRKIVALVESGILNLDYSKNPSIQENHGGWTLSLAEREPVPVDTLVDARIPTNTNCDDWSNLLNNMRSKGLVRECVLSGNNTYSTACPEISRLGNVISEDGAINRRITLYGTLTEGVTYDNDSLSRTRNNFASAWASATIELFAKFQKKPLNIQK